MDPTSFVFFEHHGPEYTAPELIGHTGSEVCIVSGGPLCIKVGL